MDELTSGCTYIHFAINCDEKEVSLEVTNCNDENIRLSEMISKREDCMIRTLLKEQFTNKE